MSNTLLEDFKKILRKEDLKITHQRISVLKEILKDDGHRECEEIYLSIKSHGVSVSRATVYRTLDILVKNNFVRKLNIGNGMARYECKINSPHHDHMICNKCDKIIEFINDDIERFQEEVAKEYHFKLEHHIHHLFGICRECQ